MIMNEENMAKIAKVSTLNSHIGYIPGEDWKVKESR